MKKYNGIFYEKNEDCFAKTAHVKSLLLYGDANVVPKPLFTVFIPTYCRTDLLEDALYSVLNQKHVDFEWDVIVVDNETYDGKANATEKLIRKINHPRVLYYRNTDHLRPGDNFNRGIFLARGKWVMMLHDDDLLIRNSLENMHRVISFLERHAKKPLGAVSVRYHQFSYDPKHKDAFWGEIHGAQDYYMNQPTNYGLIQLTHNNVLFTGHIGGDIPSNGATYNRAAVLDVGGFNDDFGISADLILYYCLENKYDVYSTIVPFGFYRWGINTMSKPESAYNTIKAGYDFREYVYSKNIFTRSWGKLFRYSQHRKFALDVLQQRKKSIETHLTLRDYDSICSKEPNRHLYAFYAMTMRHVYNFVKDRQVDRLYKKSLKDRRSMYDTDFKNTAQGSAFPVSQVSGREPAERLFLP